MTPAPSQLLAWEAHLGLVFATASKGSLEKVAPDTGSGDPAHLGDRTFLRSRQHHGPLLIQKTFYPEDTQLHCHGIVVHPPGGVAGGDCLHLSVQLEAGAKVLLTTPGAGKWYKAQDLPARQQIEFKLARDTLMEWLPQENILFDGANVHYQNSVDLADSATFVTWDVQCLGRQARAEIWQQGLLRQLSRITRQGRTIWLDQTFLEPESPLLQAKTGLCGKPVFGLMLVAHAQAPSAELLAECRLLQPAGEARYGLTALPEILAIRYVGDSAQSAKHYFERLWQLLRPWYAGRHAIRPRIWNT